MRTLIDLIGGLIIAACIWANVVIVFDHFIKCSALYRWVRALLSSRANDFGGIVIILLVGAITWLGLVAFC